MMGTPVQVPESISARWREQASRQRAAPVATAGAPPQDLGPKQKLEDISLTNEFFSAFKGSTADAMRVVGNGAGVIHSAAAKLSKATGIPLPKALDEMRTEFSYWADTIQPKPAELANPDGWAAKIATQVARAAGGALPSVALYGVATVATRNPARGMALVDALRETDRGVWEMTAAGLRGFTTGKFLDWASVIPKFGARTLSSGGIMAAQGFLAGQSPEDVLMSALTGAAFSIPLSKRASAQVTDRTPPVGSRGGPATGRPLPPTPQAVNASRVGPNITVKDPIKGIGAVAPFWKSPSTVFARFPKTIEAIDLAKELENKSRAAKEHSILLAERAFRVLSNDQRDDVIRFLNDPSVNVLNIPAKASPKVTESYRILRTLFEQKRLLIRDTKRAIGEAVPDDWGITEGYMPHEFRGPWAVFADSQVVPTGWMQKNRASAINAAKEYLKKDPQAKIDIVLYDGMTPTMFKGGKKNAGKEKFFGHAQQRKVNLPGYVDQEAAMYNYLRTVEDYVRVTRLRPYMKAAKEEISGLFGDGSWERKVLDGYVDGVEGKPGAWVSGVNRWWVQQGFSPAIVQRTLGFAQGAEAMMKLGLSPVSALNNLTQVLLNTVPVLGTKYTEKGVRGYASGKYNWLIDELGISGATNKADGAGLANYLRVTRPRLPRGPGDISRYVGETASYGWNSMSAFSMSMFQNAEKANRSVTGIGAYIRSIDEGLTHAQAIQKAERVIDRTQFHYGPADAPIIFSNQFGRTLFQFRSFMLKQMEFIMGLGGKSTSGRFDPRWKEVSRFMGGALASTGVVAIPGLDLFNYIFENLTGHAPLAEWRAKHPRLSRGILGSVYGIDTRMLGYGEWPFDPDWAGVTQFTGPVVNDLYNLSRIKLGTNPGREQALAYEKFWKGANPMVRRLYDAYLSDAANRGEFRTAKGRIVINNVTASEKLLKALGFKPLREAAAREKIGYLIEDDRRRESVRDQYMHELKAAVRNKDRQELERVQREAFSFGYRIDNEAIKAAMRADVTPLLEDIEKKAERRKQRGR